MGLLQEMFSYPFLVRAMIGGICISLCASLLGVSLVLKRYSMIGDGLSHVSFGALSIAVAILTGRLSRYRSRWWQRRRSCFFGSRETERSRVTRRSR